MFMDRSSTYMRAHERGWNDEFPEDFLEEPRTPSTSSSSSSSNDAPTTPPYNESSNDTPVEPLTPIASSENAPRYFKSSDVFNMEPTNAPVEKLAPVTLSENAPMHFGSSDDFIMYPRKIQLSDNARNTSMDFAPVAEPMKYTELAPAKPIAVNPPASYARNSFAYGQKENLPPVNSFYDFDANPLNIPEYDRPFYNMIQYQHHQPIEQYNCEMMKQEVSDDSDDDEYIDEIEKTPVTRQSMKQVGQVKHRGTPYERKTPRRSVKKEQSTVIPQQSSDAKIDWANSLLDTGIPEYVEVDTQEIVQNIKQWQKNSGRIRFNQIAFAKNILGRSQGTLSELLSNPKPWEHMKHGRSLFVRMYNWLNLSDNQKEVIWNMDLQEGKRKKGSSQQKEAPKKAREQIKFTYEQRTFLEKAFAQHTYPVKDRMQEFADKLGLEFATVNNFFMNTRRRQKKYAKKDEN